MSHTKKILSCHSNSYMWRHDLKLMGATWNPAEKGWMIPADKLEDAISMMDTRSRVGNTPRCGEFQCPAYGTVCCSAHCR